MSHQRKRSKATTGKINVLILSPCRVYRFAWNSLLSSLPFVDRVQTKAGVSEITLPDAGRQPMTVLVDAPGCESLFALQLEPYYKYCQVLFVVNNYDPLITLPLLKQGVSGFLARGDSVTNLVQTVLITVNGQPGLAQDVANQAMTELANGFQLHLALPSGLTRREIEVLHLLSHGMSNRDIAQKLFVSVRTVEAHLRSLYGKLDVSSRTEAALWAVRHGYAPLME